MKNIFNFFVLVLAITLTTGLYASGTSSDVRFNKTIFVNANETVNMESSILLNSKNKTDENIDVYDSVLCQMTVSGTTASGISYRISGHCGNVLHKLRTLEQL